MPLKRCGGDGWKWGDSGKCFTGPDAKKKAIKQGIAIEGPKKFSEKAYEDCDHFETEDIEYVLEVGYQDHGMTFSDGVVVASHLFLIDGWTEDLTENFDPPQESEYIECDEQSEAAEYQGKKVTLNKPFRTPEGPKKFAVYTKNESGKVVIVRFGDPNMEIKKDNPQRRKNFRARHNCDNPGPKWKARYWSCKNW